MKSSLYTPKYTHDYYGTDKEPSFIFRGISWIYTKKGYKRYLAWTDGGRAYKSFKLGWKRVRNYSQLWKKDKPITCYL